ncbi:MAG: ROK family transcriptional regulator [Anaerovibrio sp.]|nr:ROK family transcriptional regulator [Anaerovibrio sp.]
MNITENKRVSNQDVKKINRLNIIRSILGCKRISQQDLAKKLDISWPTVLQNVRELADLGLVQEAGTFSSTGGRKARAFAPISDAKLALGLDITRRHFGLVLSDLAGELLYYERHRQPFALTDGYFQLVAEAMEDFLRTSGYSADRILGIGVSLPGIVDNERQLLTYSHTLELRDIPLEEIAGRLPYPCMFINDANAAGYAELRGLGITGSAVYLSVSDTIGGAILNSGRLYHGDNLRAGEFGHAALVPDGRLCYCGKRGCVDAYCSTKLLANYADTELKGFFDALQQGDSRLQEWWEEYLDYLSIVINNLRMSFDCDIIVGGYVGIFLCAYEKALREKLAERNTFDTNTDYFRICHYKYEAAAFGASFLWLDSFLRSI